MEFTKELRDQLAAFHISEEEAMRLAELPDDELDAVSGGGQKASGTITATSATGAECPHCHSSNVVFNSTSVSKLIGGKTVVTVQFNIECKDCGYPKIGADSTGETNKFF